MDNGESDDETPDPSAELERSADGNWKQRYADDDIVGALEAAFPEPLSATEVAETTGCARTTAHNRLEELSEEGVVDTKKLGARSRAYWLAGDSDS